MLKFSLRRATTVVALDRFMAARIAAKGVAPETIAVVSPWSHDEVVRYDREGRERFRAEHGLDGKYVVMYSGNHSPCHPLTTLLEAARRLTDRADVVVLLRRRRERVPLRAPIRFRARPGQHRRAALSTARAAVRVAVLGRSARRRDGRSVCRHRSSRARSTTSERSASRTSTSGRSGVTSRISRRCSPRNMARWIEWSGTFERRRRPLAARRSIRGSTARTTSSRRWSRSSSTLRSRRPCSSPQSFADRRERPRTSGGTVHQPRKVLVTGAGGFIGHHLTHYLVDKRLLGARRGHQDARVRADGRRTSSSCSTCAAGRTA